MFDPGHIRLIALDLDGTLLTDDKTITPDTVAVLRELAHRGLRISFVTGRMLPSTTDYAVQVGLDEPVAVLNGSLVTYRTEPEPLLCGRIPRHHLEASLAWVHEDVSQFWFTRGELLAEHGGAERLGYMLTWNNGRDQRTVDRLSDHLDERVYQIHRVGTREALCELAMHYDDQPDLVCEVFGSARGPLYHMEVRLAEVDKGAGLRRLCEHHGISVEQSLAIGDWLNDTSLLTTAGYGVAMGNAIPQIKRLADRVLERTNNEEGVARFLEELFL